MVKYVFILFLFVFSGFFAIVYSTEVGLQPEMIAEQMQRSFTPITDQALLHPDPSNWVMMHPTYDFQVYSPLGQINRIDIAR